MEGGLPSKGQLFLLHRWPLVRRLAECGLLTSDKHLSGMSKTVGALRSRHSAPRDSAPGGYLRLRIIRGVC